MSDPSIFTKVVHASAHPEETTGAVIQPVFMTSTYIQSEPGVHKGFDYSRADNPTRKSYEDALALIEGADHALAFSSGLAAEQAIIQILEPGCKVVVSDDVYGGTGRLFRTLYAKYGIEFDFVDMTDSGAFAHSCQDPKTKMIWVETPTNPTMKMVDLEFAQSMASKSKAILVVDNTFCSPCMQNPIKFGADIVLHSTTKYIGGHSDLLGGAVMTSSKDLFDKLKFVQFAAGSVPSPMDCFLFHRSIKTLAIRMQQHSKNATRISDFLQSHPKVEKLHFPWHKDSPFFEIAAKQTSGPSGMISFDLESDYEGVKRFLSGLKVFTLAESLGGVESLVNHPEKMTHASVPEEQRKRLGIRYNLIRLSAGIEDPQDLIEDLKQALEL